MTEKTAALAAKNEAAENEFLKLRDNALDGFRNGACLDLRVRLAIELLAHSPIYGDAYRSISLPLNQPKQLAEHALDTASALITLADERGLIEPFPEHGELGRALKDHVKRQVAFQAEGQVEGMRRQKENAAIVQPVAPLRAN